MFENCTQIILKVTKDCNLRCQYCYIADKDHYRGQRMTLETFRRIIDRYCQDRQKSLKELSPLQIVFHGGEPTLAGIPRLNRFIKYAQSKIPGVSFGIQTNLTLIDKHWAKFFLRRKITPGVSIDGIDNLQQSLRSDSRQLFSKIQILEKYRVGLGPLAVLSQSNIDHYRQIKQFLVQRFKLGSIKANYVENVATPKFTFPEISGQQVYQKVFLAEMADFWQTGKIQEVNIDYLLDKFVKKQLLSKDLSHPQTNKYSETNCSIKFCGGGRSVIEVEPTGEVVFCGRWSRVNELNLLGKVDDLDLWGLSSFRKVLNIQRQKAKDLHLKDCDHCSAESICDFGCAAFAYEKRGKISIRQEIVCDYYKRAIKYLHKNLLPIVLWYLRSCGVRSRKVANGEIFALQGFKQSGYLFNRHLPKPLSWYDFEKAELLVSYSPKEAKKLPEFAKGEKSHF